MISAAFPAQTMTSAEPPLSVVFAHEGNCVALIDERAVLIERVLPLSPAALDCAEALLWRTIATATANKPAALWIVVDGDAGLSSTALLDRQRAVFERIAGLPNLFVASTIRGASVRSIAIRAVARSLARTHPQMQLFAAVEPAAQWLALNAGFACSTLTQGERAAHHACEQSASRSDR